MKTYVGQRHDNGVVVSVREEGRHGRVLDPRLDLRNHSPTGFEWGYSGSGPSQLALALLADVMGDEEIAQRYYQTFKSTFVARWEKPGFKITDAEIKSWLQPIIAAAETSHERG